MGEAKGGIVVPCLGQKKRTDKDDGGGGGWGGTGVEGRSETRGEVAKHSGNKQKKEKK